ncbi:hypothetical protein HMPREF0185_01994 [Brevundimonas diminuta 470-4]|nr:hypothetical protein HMPREF0185_01994 [Brevundimonas diminuta 470-4]
MAMMISPFQFRPRQSRPRWRSSGRSGEGPQSRRAAGEGARSASEGPGRRVFLAARGGRRPGKKVATTGCAPRGEPTRSSRERSAQGGPEQGEMRF